MLSKREYNAIAGRFIKVEETAEHIIVGLLGSLHAGNLTINQLNHIKGFYQLSIHKHSFLKDYKAPRNASMFNDYMRIEKASPAPSWMNKYQKEDFESACLKISTIQTPKDFYRVMNDINFYEIDVVNAAREYMNCKNSAQYQ